uniref:Uncharacterized protein n=1 Tax=Glossina palpalis gambiensis TaxID=67801 RepID=A0A1B0BWV7_9MUSC
MEEQNNATTANCQALATKINVKCGADKKIDTGSEVMHLVLKETLVKENGASDQEHTVKHIVKNSSLAAYHQQQLMEKKLNYHLGKEEELYEENQNLTDEQNNILADCEELRAKLLSLPKETEALKVSNFKLRDLEINNEQLLLERNQLAFKLQNAEQQVSEFCKEDVAREEIIQDLQNKLNDIQVNFSQSHVPLN